MNGIERVSDNFRFYLSFGTLPSNHQAQEIVTQKICELNRLLARLEDRDDLYSNVESICSDLLAKVEVAQKLGFSVLPPIEEETALHSLE